MSGKALPRLLGPHSPLAADVCIIGLGAMGSAAAKHCQARGARVIGLEAFGPVHGLGSSGGLSRIIRLSYFEHPDYVPLRRTRTGTSTDSRWTSTA